MHREITSPSPSSKFFSTCLNHFVEPVADTIFVKIQSSVFSSVDSVVFFRTAASISPVHALAPCSLLPLLIHCAAWLLGRLRASVATWLASSGVCRGRRATRGGQQEPALQYDAVQHRPHHQRPSRGCPLLCTRCRTVAVA